MSLPEKAQQLVDSAIECGWSYGVQWGRDTGERLYVQVDVLTGWSHHYEVTWHTRDHGTLRLFRCPLDRAHNKDMPSLAAVIEIVQANPQTWVPGVTTSPLPV